MRQIVHGNEPRNGLGPIREGELYSAELFARLVGIGRKGLAQWRRQGLRTITAGKRVYVRGGDALAWFDRLANAQEGQR